MLEVGIKGTGSVMAVTENSAAVMGSGDLPVFATPAMIALIESAAAKSVMPYLGEAESTVGTNVTVNHVAATPLGMQVRCETTLVEINRKRLVFEVRAFDESGLIGEGTHERFIIQKEKFLAKANGKLA